MSSSRAKLKLDNGVIQGARCPSLEEWPCGESLGEADSRAILRRRPQLACVTGAFDLSAGPGTPPGCGHPSFFVKVSGGAMKINRRACGWAILFSFLCLLLFVSGALGQTSRGGIAGTVADKKFDPGQTSRGGIAGTVADKSGAVVPDAAVEIEQKGTGLKL